MARYHNSPNGPRPCHADPSKGNCPYAKAGMPHFDSQQEAQKAYEATMVASYGVVAKINYSARERVHQSSYRNRDKLENKIQTVKASETAQRSVKTLKAIKNAPQTTKNRINEVKTQMRNEINRRAEEAKAGVQARAKLAADGVAVAATAAQVKHQSTMKKIRSMLSRRYEKAQTRRADDVKVGDRLDTKETVAAVYHSNGQTTLIMARDDAPGRYRYSQINSSEPIRTARWNRNPSKISQTVSRAKAFSEKMRGRIALASEQQRQVINTLRGVEMQQRTQRAWKLPESKGMPVRHKLNVMSAEQFNSFHRSRTLHSTITAETQKQEQNV